MQTLSHKQRITLAKNIGAYCAKTFPGGKSECRLAERLGVSPQAVAHWMKGTHIPTLDNLYQLSLVFETSMHELCGMKLPCDFDAKTASYEAILLITLQQKSSHQQHHARKKNTKIMRMITSALKTELQTSDG